MIVFDAVSDPEPRRRAEISVFEDDALRKGDARIRFGAGDRIADRAAFHLDVLTTFHARLDAIEGEIVRGLVRAVHLRPRPAENAPRSPNLASDELFNRRALCSICALIDQDQGLAVAFVNRAGPVDVDGEAQAIEPDVAKRALLDVPRPAAFAFASGWPRVEVAGTAPIAIARDKHLSIEAPALCHVTPRDRDDRLTATPCQGMMANLDLHRRE